VDVAEALDDLADRVDDLSLDNLTSTGLTAGKVYHWDAGTSAYVLADPDDAICETCELLLAVSTTRLIAGGLADVTVGSGVVGSAIYLDDAGAVTATVPSSPDDDGRVGRMVGWVRSGTTIRFDGHIPGGNHEATST
jgi:hypothetical protein